MPGSRRHSGSGVSRHPGFAINLAVECHPRTRSGGTWQLPCTGASTLPHSRQLALRMQLHRHASTPAPNAPQGTALSGEESS